MLKHLFFIVFNFLAVSSFTYAQTIRFNALTIKDGLSQSTVNCISQDYLGYLWIGTQDGLNRYDGVDFKIYRHQVNDKNSLSNSFVQCIEPDSDGNFWVGTESGGVNHFDIKRNLFSVPEALADFKSANIRDLILIDENLYIATEKMGLLIYNIRNEEVTVFNKNTGFSSNKIKCLTTAADRIWIGTEGQGLIVMDKSTNQWSNFKKSAHSNSLGDDNINVIVEKDESELIIGTNDGLYTAEVSTVLPTFKKVKIDGLAKENPLSAVTSILLENDSSLLIGSYGTGLLRIAYRKEKFELSDNYLSSDWDNSTLQHNQVNSIFKDFSGNIWIGTQDGISYFDPVKQGFSSYKYVFNSNKGLLDKTVWCVFKDDSLTWVGTREGITLIINRGKDFYQFPFNSSNLNSPNNNSIYDIYKDIDGKMWAATSSGISLLHYDSDFSNFRYEIINFRDNESEWDDNTTYTLSEDQNNNLLGACKDGLAMVNIRSLKTRFYNAENVIGFPSAACRYFFIDSKKNIWLGFNGAGLGKLTLNVQDSSSAKIKLFKHDQDNSNSVSNNTVLSIIEEPESTLWLSTFGGGVCKYNIITDHFTSYTEEDGLANNAVYGIVKGNNPNILWVSTNYGISKFNFNELTFQNYHESDGLLSNEFNTGAYYKDEEGRIYFGGTNGLNLFYPEDIVANRIPPKVVFTEVLVYNKPLEFEEGEISNISYKDEIVLDYRENNITFKFSALHYTYPEANEYEVQLIGIDEEPIKLGRTHQVNYSNLSPGEYELIVYAINSDGVKSTTPTTLGVTITAPFWSTWWFLSVMIVLLGLIVYAIYVFRIRSIKHQKEKLAFLVEKRTRTITEQNEKMELQTRELEAEKNKVEELLLNILPAETAEALKTKGKTKPRYYRMVTVLFSDIRGFTKIAENYKPTELVKKLDYLFRKIDNIIEKHQIEKIKTIGDAYMAAGGVPLRDKENPVNSVLAALEIQQMMKDYNENENSNDPWELRIGLNTGDVIAGVIGTKRIAYDIWGNTVNVAQRMEAASEQGKVNISGTTYDYIKPYFDCTYRGKVPAKNKGEIDMYYVDGIKSHLSEDGEGLVPNHKFKDYVNLHIYSSINYRKAERHIMKILKARLSPNLHYHGIHHTYDVVDAVERLAIMEGILDEGIFILKSAATYHDAGFVEEYDANEPIGARMASEILPLYGYTEQQVQQVHDLIYATRIPHNPQNKMEEIICDADLDYLGRDDFDEISDTLRRELRDHGKIDSDRLWDEIQVKFLTAHKYFTESAIKTRRAKKLEHLEKIKQRLIEDNYKD